RQLFGIPKPRYGDDRCRWRFRLKDQRRAPSPAGGPPLSRHRQSGPASYLAQVPGCPILGGRPSAYTALVACCLRCPRLLPDLPRQQPSIGPVSSISTRPLSTGDTAIYAFLALAWGLSFLVQLQAVLAFGWIGAVTFRAFIAGFTLLLAARLLRK